MYTVGTTLGNFKGSTVDFASAYISEVNGKAFYRLSLRPMETYGPFDNRTQAEHQAIHHIYLMRDDLKGTDLLPKDSINYREPQTYVPCHAAPVQE